MVVDSTYNIGDIVYLKTDPDQYSRVVTAITIEDESITYRLSFVSDSSWHFDFEITRESNVLKNI